MFYQHYQDKRDYFNIGTCPCRDHFHRAIELMYCISTDKPMKINGMELTIGEGELVLVPPLAVHSAPSVKGQRTLCVVMPLSYSDVYDSYTSGKEPVSYVIKDKTAAEDMFNHLLQLENCDDQLLRQGIYTYVLAKILRYIPFADVGKSENLNFSTKILEYIEAHYSEKLTQQELSKAFAYNKNYFSALFKKHVHISFSSYLNIVRINKAIPLLEEMTVSEIAYRVGYANVQSFLQNFKKITGRTPREYMADTKEKNHL